MAQYDVYRNPRRGGPAKYLLDVQHRLFSDLRTRVVVPLVPAEGIKPMTRLNPVFRIERKRWVMSTTELAGIHLNDIGEKVGSLSSHEVEIISALDYLLTGV
jgi:toxin CcdB